ncbi:MAG: hypothetical protein A2664_02090 [Candidatus Taylorbacteria bacterium RIFCSPHIGHO2_01_FULL_46_22b]|uniref:Type 4 fimbrial biogenesis protein PilX N-terminal domain-containing protein n=1 Tax=Candidatus Taylorbacteria bacterium RIFCSPHIGHO2_01_FULL_46_22b TaxID=1802301 RepID=A0A1G2M2Y1_9BACT|nr:MAG: hypothetical protein A2664_02090 [Candidatus Taylorbacteria bacterium RIFCSPHIGHO2_01_FULL_46_22b]
MRRFISNFSSGHHQRGFTLYYAVLFAGLLLAVGASMLNLTLKEFLLSASLKESSYAFFAADSGMDCALYWNWKGLPVTVREQSGVFRSVTFPLTQTDGNGNIYNAGYNLPAHPLTGTSNIRCNGDTPVTMGNNITNPSTPVPPVILAANSATTTFRYDVGTGGNLFCTIVAVGKQINGTDVTTTIQSRGYNVSCGNISNNTRAVERALVLQYPKL